MITPAHRSTQQVASNLHHLTPAVVVALDPAGAQVCQRLAALMRANARGDHQLGSAAVRDRFAFIQLRLDPSQPTVSDVSAVLIDPSNNLWDMTAPQWIDRAFQERRGGLTFASAFRNAVQGVLGYPLVQEELRARGLVVKPSHLNVFFVGTLIEAIDLDTFESTAPQTLADQVGGKLDRLEQLAQDARLYAEQSAHVDVMVRGSFLSLVLPDSIALARPIIEPNGERLGTLLRRPAYGHYESPLHFCALYTNHDERGAWYPSEQLVNVQASALYALMLSELTDSNTCLNQLGLRDPYAAAADRLVTIAATRSTFPRADLLDYAALRYAALLLEQVLPAETAPISDADRAAVAPRLAEVLRLPTLQALVQRPAGPPWDAAGVPARLTRLAVMVGSAPPDLWEVIKDPQLDSGDWPDVVGAALSQLEQSQDNAVYLREPSGPGDPEGIALVDDAGLPLPLRRADGSSFDYQEIPLLRDWQRWRTALEEQILGDSGEVAQRAAALRDEIDAAFWGDVPAGVRLSGVRYCAALLDHASDQLREIGRSIEAEEELPLPTDAEIAEQLQHARQQSAARLHLSPVVMAAAVFAVMTCYLLMAVAQGGAAGAFGDLLRGGPPALDIPLADARLALPIPLYLGALAGLLLLLAGMLIRLWQTRRALLALRAYAALLRQRLAVLMYRDERRRLAMLPRELIEYIAFLRSSLDAFPAWAPVARQRLSERAEQIAQRGFQDVTEYLPAVQGGSIQLYRVQIEPGLHDLAQQDLPLLRRIARECGPLIGPHTTDPAVLEQRAMAAIAGLIRGDPAANEHAYAARMRWLVYRTLQRTLDDISRSRVSHVYAARVQELQQRTHVMMSMGYHGGGGPFQQSYLVTPMTSGNTTPALAEAEEVSSLDDETVMYVRVVSRIWPRLFEGSGVKLE